MQENKKHYKGRVIIVLVFLLLFALYSFISLRGKYIEFKEISETYLPIFEKQLKYKFIILGFTFVFLFSCIYITTVIIKKGLKHFFYEEKKEIPKLPNKSISLIISIIFSIVISNTITNETILAFSNTSFADYILNIDIGYFIFQKPFIELILLYLIGLFIFLTIYIAIYYISVFNVYFDGISRETLKKNEFIKQLIINLIILAFLIASLITVKSQDIVFKNFLTLKDESKTELIGAGTTDTIIGIWGYRIFAIIIIICTFFSIHYFKKRKTKKTIISIAIIPGYLLSMFIIMTLFQLVFVDSNELENEKNYILENIYRTKKAYNIEIEENEIIYEASIAKELAENNMNIIKNIPIVTKDVVNKTLSQYQSNLGHYSYKNTKLGNYIINGDNTLTYISPREIVNSGDRTYSNKTYEYTHGYGIILTNASKFDETGKIEYIQKEIDGIDSQINIKEPRIYYGLETNETIITNTTTKEYDYPISNYNNAENTYTGTGGINLNFLDRLILSLNKKDLKLILDSKITKDSKILTNRNIIQRAKTIMPYLLYDSEPYIVIRDNGELVWILDAYTISSSYPYSQMTSIELNGAKNKINYIRNSIKVIVNAYNGDITFYLTDKTDPLAMAYWRVFPDLFADINESQIPEDISKHIIYPEFLYNIQSKVLTKYHNIQPEVLYRSDDVWDIAKSSTSKNTQIKGMQIEPYYSIIKNNSGNEALSLIVPYTPYGKQNIISYLVGSYENGSNKLILNRFSSGSSIPGPMQLNTQIEQDQTISEELKFLNVTGTKLVKNMIIIPIENSLLYIEPVYQVSVNESQIPVLKKIIIASGTKVTIGNTIEDALNNLFSNSAVEIEIQNTDDLDELINAIIKANSNLQESREGQDWELIGKDIKKLQELIKQLEILKLELDKKNKTLDNIETEIINNNIFKDE